MASEKRTYPSMAVNHWNAIRKKFKSAIPTILTRSYLASIGIPEGPIRSYVIPTLRKVGLIDDDNKPTDKVRRWREDSTYPEVCAELICEIYPDELRSIAPDLNADRSQVITWFSHETGAGESALRKMAAFYWMLLEADPSDGKEANPTASKPTPRPSKRPLPKPAKSEDQAKPPEDSSKGEMDGKVSNNGKNQLALHFNIQVHISPEADANQIEKIFESMEKHLKGFVS